MNQRRQHVLAKPYPDSATSRSTELSPSTKPVSSIIWPTLNGNSDKPVRSDYTDHHASSDAAQAINDILKELVHCVKSFKTPSELDFSLNADSPLILVNNENNKPFLDQLRKLDGLRTRLNAVSSSGDKNLENKHRTAQTAIVRALQRMKELQLKLYEKFTASTIKVENSAIDDVLRELVAFVKKFKLPSELDFSPRSTEKSPLLVENEMNKPFIDQLRKLDGLQTRLAAVPTHENEWLKTKHRAVGVAIGRSRRRMQDHQLQLYKTYKGKLRTGVSGFFYSLVQRFSNKAADPDPALVNLLDDLNDCFRNFQFPSGFDFSKKAENTLVVTGKNNPIMIQLRKIDKLRAKLAERGPGE